MYFWYLQQYSVLKTLFLQHKRRAPFKGVVSEAYSGRCLKGFNYKTEGDHKGSPYGAIMANLLLCLAYFITESFFVKRLLFRGDKAEIGGQDGGTVFGGYEVFCGYSVADGFYGVAHKYYSACWVVQYDQQFFDKYCVGVC